MTNWSVPSKDSSKDSQVTKKNGSSTSNGVTIVPSQTFLTSLVQTFPQLFANIKNRFAADDMQQLSVILQRVLAVPVSTDSTPFLLPVGEAEVTPLQNAMLTAFQMLEKVLKYSL